MIEKLRFPHGDSKRSLPPRRSKLRCYQKPAVKVGFFMRSASAPFPKKLTLSGGSEYKQLTVRRRPKGEPRRQPASEAPQAASCTEHFDLINYPYTSNCAKKIFDSKGGKIEHTEKLESKSNYELDKIKIFFFSNIYARMTSL